MKLVKALYPIIGALIWSFLIMITWNYLSETLGLPRLDYWHACAVWFLSQLLFTSIGDQIDRIEEGEDSEK